MPKDLSYMYPVYPVIRFFTMLAVLIPIPTHWKAGNIAIISLAMWTWLGLLISMVNTIVWHGNIRNPYPIWMDICNVYFVMLPVGIASSTLCVQYKLWTIATTRIVLISEEKMRRQKYTTYFLCVGLPVIVCGLHAVVQGHRGDIIEDVGPITSTYNVTLAFVLYYPWEPVICLISGVFSVMTIRCILAHRKDLYKALATGSANVSKDRYLRLVWLATVAIIIHLPLASWSIIVNGVKFKVYPWISWEDTHSNYKRIRYFTRFMMSQHPTSVAVFSIGYWAIVLCGINFFIFFGFGEEASQQYRAILAVFLKPFGIEFSTEKKPQKIKKTWIDILLCRSGKPANYPSPTSGSTTRRSDIVSNSPARFRPDPQYHGLPKRPQATIAKGDLNMNIPGVTSLGRTEATKKAGIADYMRPDQSAQKTNRFTGCCDSISSSAYGESIDEKDQERFATAGPFISGHEVRFPERVASIDTPVTLRDKRSSTIAYLDIPASVVEGYLKGDISKKDIEAQESDEETIVEERRAAILEKNPELTEEITF
ncbi:STE3-domain-containing protein [Serendipita vermifera]|nr:STE3-domain-containing protein [Serendipita vermifera]